MQEHVGAESLIEAYHIVTLGFSEVVKDHANPAQDSRLFRILARTLMEVFFYGTAIMTQAGDLAQVFYLV